MPETPWNIPLEGKRLFRLATNNGSQLPPHSPAPIAASRFTSNDTAPTERKPPLYLNFTVCSNGNLHLGTWPSWRDASHCSRASSSLTDTVKAALVEDGAYIGRRRTLYVLVGRSCVVVAVRHRFSLQREFRRCGLPLFEAVSVAPCLLSRRKFHKRRGCCCVWTYRKFVPQGPFHVPLSSQIPCPREGRKSRPEAPSRSVVKETCPRTSYLLREQSSSTSYSTALLRPPPSSSGGHVSFCQQPP